VKSLATIGMVRVAAKAARTAGALSAKMTSTLSATSSLAALANRDDSPSVLAYVNSTSLPSTQP